ncbi:MAG TPA: ATP-binding protein [Gemmatimonadaceae bacterium]|nr:ATP-binding protein [Gemmatimonadaceae bacterium]
MTRTPAVALDAHPAPRVLVVDDTPGNRYAVARILRSGGMHVVEADNGRDALRLVQSIPDLVLLDIKLPDVSGYEICRAIKRNPATAFIPVMHVSATYTNDADRAYGLEAGADAYLTHPIDPGLLLATSRALLRASRAEAGFRRAALQWRTTFDAISNPIFLVDGGGVVRRCNRAAAALLNCTAEDVTGETWSKVLLDLGLSDHEELAKSATGGNARDLEVALQGRRFTVSTDHTEDDGEDSLVVCVWSDVTALEAARLEAEAANRAKSDFLAVMSHELRTPLNAIVGFTELLSLGIRGPITAEQQSDLERIRRSQRTLLGLINDVLRFAKLESSSVAFEITDVPLDEAVASAADFVEVQLHAKALHFVHHCCSPSAAVRADAEKLQQILLNLLSNATKFTPSGGTITVSCERDGDCVLLHVSDTGPGIPAERFEAIFDPFVQGDQRLVREHQGVGLGLAISRGLARGMGGEITVDSRVGEGSTFTVKLPAAR